MCGLSEEEFWDLSPREMRREMALAKVREEDRQRRDVVMAWNIAALSRQEKLPELRTLLRLPPRQQTPAEQRAVLQKLSAQYGIPLREKAH